MIYIYMNYICRNPAVRTIVIKARKEQQKKRREGEEKKKREEEEEERKREELITSMREDLQLESSDQVTIMFFAGQILHLLFPDCPC